MKDIFKALVTIIVFSSAFILGFHIGEERVKNKYPNFQEDLKGKS
jgi:hypothetical protein